MEIIEIFENEKIILNSEDVLELSKILNSDNKLPITLEENTLCFADYIIGEIKFGNKIIRIKPRHNYLTLSHYFEMLLYIEGLNTNNLKSDSFTFSNNQFGINGLIENFITVTKELVDFGISGSYVPSYKSTFNPVGRIDFKNFSIKQLPISGVNVYYENYDYNNDANKLLKSALIKVIEIFNSNSKETIELDNILSFFNKVDIMNFELDSFKINSLEKFYSSNIYYDVAIQFAIKIILDLKFVYSEKLNLNWSTFLVNSNIIFEKYIFTLLNNNLKNNVSKFNKPVNFAQFEINNIVGEKSYNPDIIIDYSEGRARGVFDCKNKYFTLSKNNLSDLVNVSDIYQLLFYSQQLNSDICGLIYPTDMDIENIELNIKGSNSRFFLITINMTDCIEQRNKKLLNSLNKCLIHS